MLFFNQLLTYLIDFDLGLVWGCLGKLASRSSRAPFTWAHWSSCCQRTRGSLPGPAAPEAPHSRPRRCLAPPSSAGPCSRARAASAPTSPSSSGSRRRGSHFRRQRRSIRCGRRRCCRCRCRARPRQTQSRRRWTDSFLLLVRVWKEEEDVFFLTNHTLRATDMCWVKLSWR